MSIKILILMVFINSQVNSQSIIHHYKGGEKKLIDDISSNIDVPRELTKEKMSYVSQLYMHINKSGKLDSITTYNTFFSNYDSILFSALYLTNSSWKKSKKGGIVMATVWFFSDDNNNIVIDKRAIPYVLPKKNYDNVFVLKPIVYSYYYAEGKKHF